jgi:glyoxylase-like metal-dependent hydrolase (beta-lactamase superfamily II)
MPASYTADPELIDLLHLGRPHVVGAWRVGEVIVDPGPSSCLAQLMPGLERDPPRVLALTHIHLDHAGATGSLLRRFPDAEVWVHERGARHMIDPSRLLESATRLYGADMERLWGDFLAVPADRVRVLEGGETLGAFRVAYTPGHASHHVSYLHEPSGHAFTGDVAGVRIGEGPILAPTPPPDIDLEAWRSSLRAIEEWRPSALALTHFGSHERVEEHLSALREHLERAEALASEGDEAAFAAMVRGRVAQGADPATAAAYEQATPPEQSFQGLARYLSRRDRSV